LLKPLLSSAPSEPQEAHTVKRFVVQIDHNSYPPYRLKLRPATKVSDVLTYLGLNEDYVLYPVSNPQKHFTPEKDLYELIENDEKLIVTLSPEAAEKYAHLFIP
jgi:hypothetical protein